MKVVQKKKKKNYKRINDGSLLIKNGKHKFQLLYDAQGVIVI